ncbi:large subunit of alpha-aminoadipate reductase [Entomophthora muscae]|uniref:Large subunit of alpha-aminoadipate reductase n=1 Tax=Entomophthora muscae TaxID=34485 RepID=A0ACC2TUE5_9FUNG|nr:large subunit of alpha-aminoadipate reductase [Entomophthora muscae]
MAPNVFSQEPGINENIGFWREKLSNITEFQLPLDYPRPLPSRYVDATVNQALPESASLAILQLSLANKVATGQEEAPASPFIILLSAFAVLLHRYTGEEDIIVGSSSLSSNPLVLRLPVQGSMSFSEVLKVVHEVENEANAHDIPFHQLFEALYPTDANQTVTPPPLFRVRFFNQTDTSEDTLNQTTINDLTVLISSKSSGSLRSLLPSIEVTVSYNQVLFSSARIGHILEQLGMVLERALRSPEEAISHFPLVTPRCLQAIPDPTAPLGWEDWKGAIPDIFTQNAHRHPERLCLVETLITGQTRVFSYQQVNRAANLVAHYLIQKGVAREDVVTMYAYRGVDLAVGVMGILKAGCTFNVIDPAYPAARQEIYLSVAKPRAILVLKQAGKLLPSVREYIDKELQLKCELSGMQLQDDGSLLHTEDAIEKPFDSSLQDKDANVELGPDSVATLSFTSGSTGIPKGVRGRHFSLTHFYPWMAQEFGLSEQDRFTMLSGIAHDPIQRDIFTPLFLGAQLHIPDPEIIGIPGQLAQWMCDSQVSVTHLTPAMGQLLSANAATSIPSLRNAFFVGDILTKRDCLRLQHLANNTSIVNMYGTTETQRAVSYYRVPALSVQPSFLPSAKDVLPAGKGMHNVQLLVVSRTPDANGKRAMCGVGEVGEIYVRSSGLSEGYLGLDEATSEKFLVNWFAPAPASTCQLPFFHGPRDRMYRSGDLGRYLPDGTVECIGRADDQVKIRGFRIELGEIDTHLSQHPRIRENVTLVRRDQNEEQTLVAYFVPSELPDEVTSSEEPEGVTSLQAPRKYRKLIRDIREWLKQKLPSYSVPSVFVPLIKMPLNPNGKIDKPALPFPDTVRQVAPPHAVATMSPTEKLVYNIWISILNSSQQISLDDNFFDMGGHSILATRLIFQIRKDACVDVPLGLVFQQPTIRGMAQAVDEVRSLDLNIAGLDSSEATASAQPEANEYSTDFDALLKASPWSTLDKAHISPRALNSQHPTFFLTGATGFLGAFILSYLLARHPGARVFCLARADSEAHALQRVQENCRHQLVWKDSWDGRVLGVKGDLASKRLGIDNTTWDMLVEQVDAIVHNGAQVHWVYPYAKLRNANVLGTVEVLSLALAQPNATKSVHFVSSTSVLDTQHYVNMSERLLNEGNSLLGVPEWDDLEGSRTGLGSGYGQSKWVSERLMMSAGACGVPTTIIRPGYIVGDSSTGVSVSDDFLWRLVKGCIQLNKVPRMDNVVNMCPVDYVAKATVEAAFSSAESQTTTIYHITNPHRFRFSQFFQALFDYGYAVDWSDYVEWRGQLMDVTLSSGDNALYPLLHFVLDDLPTSTKAPELDATNTLQLLSSQGITCPPMGGLMGRYLAYLIHAGFLPPPSSPNPECQLPVLDLPAASLISRSNRI